MICRHPEKIECEDCSLKPVCFKIFANADQYMEEI